jgi:hypothetical protein
MVRYDDDNATSGGECRGRKVGEQGRPVTGRYGGNCARVLPRAEPGQQLGAAVERVYAVSAGHCRVGRRSRGSSRSLLGRRVPRWDGEPDDVCHRAGPSVSYCAGKRRNLIRENNFVRDNALEICHSTGMLGLADALENKPIDQLPSKSHPNTSARLRSCRLLLTDEIVKSPIKMRQRNVHKNPSNRQLSRSDLRGLRLSRALLARRTTRGHKQVLAAASDECGRVGRVVEEH